LVVSNDRFGETYRWKALGIQEPCALDEVCGERVLVMLATAELFGWPVGMVKGCLWSLHQARVLLKTQPRVNV
jgi:hypothetical protein